jgi:RNA recognition motif-containing protein
MKLYVGNLPYQATEEQMTDWFAEHGITPDSVSLVRDRFSGEARGFGFVEIEDAEQAETAIQSCHDQDFLGRKLVINEARPKPAMGGGGGGGRGGFGGGGGGGGYGGGGGGGGRDRRGGDTKRKRGSSDRGGGGGGGRPSRW